MISTLRLLKISDIPTKLNQLHYKFVTPCFQQTRATNYANFCDCISFCYFFSKTPQNTSNSSRCSRYMVIVFVPQLFLWRCGRSFRCSRSKRLQRVVHRTPTMTTTKACICVLRKLTWRLYKRMYLLFSSQHLHITKLCLVIFSNVFLIANEIHIILHIHFIMKWLR